MTAKQNNETVANAAEEVRKAAEEVKQVAETTKEVAKEVTGATVQGIEKSTNYVLDFLGVPIDLSNLVQGSVEFAINLTLALLIFFVGQWVGKRVLALINRVLERTHLDQTVLNFLNNVLYGVMFVMVSVAALNKLGVNTNSFVAVLGATAVAIGMALKDQLSNLAAGVMIVIFRPFSRGDIVEVGGKLGTVLDITLVNTRIKTAANHEIIIPNGDIMTTSSVNYTSLPTRRVDVVVGIGYHSDIKKAREVMLRAADSHELVLRHPEPLVRVTALSDSSVDLTLYVWTENSDWFSVQCDLLEQIKYAFDEQGVDIPFPNRTLHLDGLDTLTKLLQEQSQKQPHLSTDEQGRLDK